MEGREAGRAGELPGGRAGELPGGRASIGAVASLIGRKFPFYINDCKVKVTVSYNNP